ncbi:MAG: protein translocase subunit SecD [Planctomycetales bacterium]|nr:protein translocase subunit SecD [Planctomycetales bacterium]
MDGFSLTHALSLPWLLAQAETTVQQGTSTNSPEAWGTYGYGALFVLGIFVFPFIISHFITRALRMPAHSFRLGVMLAAISGGLLFAWGNNFQLTFGPDFKGGTNLVYDILADENGEKINSGALATALSDRINPSGTKEITIRPRGESQIEITVPNVDEFELKKIKELMKNSGQLEFRIVANTRDHQDVIELAREQAASNTVPKTDVVNAEGRVVGRWYNVGREQKMQDGVFPLATPVLGDIIRNTVTGEVITIPQLDMDENFALEKWMKRTGVRDIDVLMALESLGKPFAVVTGDDLFSAQTGFEKTGQPIVEFRLNSTGANKMLSMTSRNQPDGEFHRRMAIIMDKKVLSAPQLNSPISNSGQISGRFTKEEVDFLVTILRSGRLPATLSEEPASENRVGAGLGATTIQKGTNASLWAVIATFISILVYYRFAGVVASMALLINGLLIFGVMIFIDQPLTLPGLAGLVLTVGMSVDANVLIFERIREEKRKGAAPRMAIRNGFDRAFTTIIDSNLTTLIAAIVLYWIGTDQVRGFAVALIIGIATSMFTATFCSRIVFEIAEKLKLVSLSMSDGVGFLKRTFLGDADFNFTAYQKACAVLSGLAILVGITAVSLRGKELLNIDFTGGTSVTFQLQEAVEVDKLRQVTRDILAKDENDKPVQSTLVRVEKNPPGTVYTLVTSIEDVNFLSKTLLEGFAKNNTADLVTYRVKVLKEKPADTTGALPAAGSHTVRYVAYQDEPTAETETAANDTPVSDASANDTPQNPPAEGTTTAEPAAEDENLAVGVPTSPKTELVLEFSGSNDDEEIDEADKGAKIDGPTLREQLIAAAESAGIAINPSLVSVAPVPLPAGWVEDDLSGFATWSVSLPLEEAAANTVVSTLTTEMQKQPKWLSLSQIGTRVAGEMQQRAIAAILLSLVFIVAYIWFRFQKVAYGLAAVVALVHDVIITLGILALCHWLSGPLGFLLIEDFKIGLTEVAAFLTIIGYSLNDTIVVFDRIREVRGRSPKLTAQMINDSVNQTLSRTLLTSGTTLLTVFLLYTFGGEGIHAFAFALLVGIIVGTYSSVFIAAPILLWLSSREATNQRPGTSV